MPDILDLYDKDKKPLGIQLLRGCGQPVPQGAYFMIVSVMTVRPDGKILMTRRAAGKSYAGKWEITGGAKVAGETALEAACRELYEETGIVAQASEMEWCGSSVETVCIREHYLLRKDIPLDSIRLQKGETDASRWVTPEELLAVTEAGLVCGLEVSDFLRHYPMIFV